MEKDILIYLWVFAGSLIVDLVPFIGPPAWTVMTFFQIRYNLDIWMVLIIGVPGSAVGRYLYSNYISQLSNRFIKQEKNTDLRFIGKRMEKGGWRVQLFVFLYTLMPLPSTPLFTATGVAKIKTLHIIPAFLAGKFISDAIMVITGDYVAKNVTGIIHGLLSWKSILGTFVGLVVICLFLFINWRQLLEEKKFGLSFKIWK
jgi:membrane protein DedA with SNARE-associated domain